MWKKTIPPWSSGTREYVESVQRSPVNMQNTWEKIVSNLNSTIPHSVHLVNPNSIWLLTWAKDSCPYSSQICESLLRLASFPGSLIEFNLSIGHQHQVRVLLLNFACWLANKTLPDLHLWFYRHELYSKGGSLHIRHEFFFNYWWRKKIEVKYFIPPWWL